MANKLKVEVLVGLVDRLTGPLKRLQGKLRRVGTDMSFAGGAMALPLIGAARAFAQAEDAATRMQLAAMRAGGTVNASFAELNALAISLGDRMPGTTADFQAMLTMLQRQGLSAETILAGTGAAAANLAVLLQQSPEQAAEFAAKLQDATTTASKDMLSLADTIQRSFYAGVDPGNMLEAFAALAPAMALIRQQGLAGANAMAPLIAMLDQAGLSGSKAGNAMRKVLQRGFDAGSIGLDLTRGGEFRGVDNLLKQLSKLKGLTAEDRLTKLGLVWGDDSETLQALNVLIEKGAAGYAEMSAKMAEQASLQERMAPLLATTSNLWEAMTGTLTNLVVAVAGSLAPEIKSLTRWLNDLAAGARQWVGENQGLVKVLATVAVGLTAFIALAGTLSLAVWAVSLAFTPLLGALGLLLSPLGLTIAGIAALVAAFMYFRDDIVRWVVDAVVAIQARFELLMAFFVAIKTRLMEVGRNLIDGLWQGISERWEALKTKVAGIANAITGIFRSETETKSPSRVFKALGMDLMRGLEVGIAAGARLPLAEMRAATLGLGVAAMPMGAAAGPSGGIHMPITIHITAPAGADAQSLAELVRREVSGATRTAAGRIAALYDGVDGL